MAGGISAAWDTAVVYRLEDSVDSGSPDTTAHKLEQLSEYKIRHGEAVAIGIALDVIYSRRMGFLDAVSAGRILRLIEVVAKVLREQHGHEVRRRHAGARMAGLGGGGAADGVHAQLLPELTPEFRTLHPG